MQMYLFTYTTPNRDGDLDNGVITHEYGHGISNRLTGGPANSSCLSNTETGSEGWSDYVALMTTTNWATALTTDGTKSRPMGTYVLGQATTGAGIRIYPYSTNMAVNPWTYAMLATNTSGEVHNVGEIWCTALWDMTWELIAMDGINPNLYNASGTGGNSAALKLVIEGMRLQPCNPGFIDSRNAILKADTIFFGAKYSCAIWKAFARRGMGAFASQGSTNSYTDQVASFVDGGSMTLSLTQSLTQQQEGLQVTYTNRVTAGGCSGVSNYLLTDTLPSNVTYISGGTYNAGNRVVSFPVNLAAGQSQTYSFTVQINNGSYFPPQTLLDEQVTGTAGTIPTGWTAASTTTSVWTTHNTRSKSAPNSFFTPNRTTVSDQTLALTSPIVFDANPPELSFWHWINSESGWDGGVVEITTNNGTTWTDLGSRMTTNGYNGSLGASGNALSGRNAFTGNSNAFIRTAVDLSSYAGQSVRFRFRFGSDESVAVTGWNIDDILLSKQARVKIKSNLFSNTNALVAASDTFTVILQNSCVAGSISSQPAPVSICANGNATFSVSASGTAITYQWQVSTDGGTTYNNISGETGSTLNLTNVSASANGNRYRCVINGTCTTALNSDPAVLTVVATPAAPSVTNGAVCGSGVVNLSASTSLGNAIDWYTTVSGGTAFLTNATAFTTPVITNTTTYYVEARNTTLGCLSVTRTPVTATVNPLPTMLNTSGASVCGSGSSTISATASAGSVIDWYTVSGGGTALQSGSTTFTTPVLSSTTTYYAEVRNSSTGCKSATRSAVTLTVNALPAISNVSGASLCGTGSASINAGASIGAAVDWYAASSGGSPLQLASNVFNTPALTVTTTYYAEARDVTTGCISATRVPVTVTVLAKTSSTTNITICNNQLPYEWNGNSYSSGGSYTLHFINSVGCDSAATLNLSVLPAILHQTLTGGGSYNSGGAGVPVGLLSSQLNVSYQLILNGNTLVGSPVSGTGAAIGFGNQTAAGLYTVLASYLGCEQLMPGSVTITIVANQPPAAFVVTGGGTYCQGSSGVTVGLANSELGVNYQLYRSNGSIAVGAVVAGTGSAIDFGLQTSTGDYTVTATRLSNGLTQVMLNSVLVRMAQLRTPSAPGAVTGPTDVCSLIGGAPVLYKINQASNATSYIWTAPAGASIIGSNTDTAVLIQYPVGFVSGTLSVQSVNACFGNAVSSVRNVSITRRVPGTPSAIVASNSNPCSILGTNNTIIYTTRSVTYASGYAWTLGAGMMLVGSQGDTGIVVRFDAGFTSGTISVVATNACWTSNARSLTVTASKPAVPVAISGPTAVCDLVGVSATATYSIAEVNGATGYVWTVPANATIVNGQGTASISVQYQSGFTSGSIMVASASPCGNSSARSLSVAATKPGTPVVISGPTQVCTYISSATTAFYSIDPVANATSYQWTAPANASIVSGQGTTTVELLFTSAFASGNISVRAAANCGISSARSMALTKSVARPGAITASAPPCPNTTVTYSIDPVVNATGYQWALPSNAIYVSGQGTTSYTVTFKPAFTTGQVAVKALNACSSSANTTLALDGAVCSQFQKGLLATAEYSGSLIYPNPARNSFRIQYMAMQSNESIRLFIIDQLGKTVKQESVRSVTAGRNQASVFIGNLPSGIYEVRLIRNGSVESIKLVVAE
jgi:uncharacterized repeat protein (TIGR01451 family)